MYATDFIFDGVSLSSKGYMICTFDGDSVVSGGEIEPIVRKTPSTDEYTYYAAEINNVLTWELGICKLPCGTEDFEPLNQYEESELAKWLLKTDGYRWLQFVQPDDYPDVYYKVYINMTPAQIGGVTYGYNLTITSNCGYGFSGERIYQFSSNSQPLTINVDNDLNRYIYPTVSFETNSNECWIYNENDLEQNLSNNKETHFYDLGDNYDNPIELSMDSENDIVNGITTPDQFNFRYLRLVNGENNIYTDGVMGGTHRSETEYSEQELVAIATQTKSYTTLDISYYVSENGIRVENREGTNGAYILYGSGQTTYRGTYSAGDTITLPSGITSFEVYPDRMYAILENTYSYVYITRAPYLFICSNTPLEYYEESINGYVRTTNGTPFDVYEFAFTNGKIIQRQIDNIGVTSHGLGIYGRRDNFWINVPIEIKDANQNVVVPVISKYNPRRYITPKTEKIFELTGLPSHYQTQEDFEAWEDNNHGCIVRHTSTTYQLIEFQNHNGYVDYDFEQTNYGGNIKLTATGSGSIYTYSTANKQWTLSSTFNNGYEQLIGISSITNGFIGDIVYTSPNTDITYNGAIVSPFVIPIVDTPPNYNFNNNNWAIYNPPSLQISNQDVRIDSSQSINWEDAVNSRNIFARLVIDIDGDEKSTVTINSPKGLYIFNNSNYDSDLKFIYGTENITITVPTSKWFYADFYGEESVTLKSDEDEWLIYQPDFIFDDSHTLYLNKLGHDYGHAYLNISMENEIAYEDSVLINNEYVYNFRTEYNTTYDITDIVKERKDIFTYDQYDLIESEQNGTIKFREIRRVLV